MSVSCSVLHNLQSQHVPVRGRSYASHRRSSNCRGSGATPSRAAASSDGSSGSDSPSSSSDIIPSLKAGKSPARQALPEWLSDPALFDAADVAAVAAGQEAGKVVFDEGAKTAFKSQADLMQKMASGPDSSSGEQLEGSTVPPASAAQRSTASLEPEQAAAGNPPDKGSTRFCLVVGSDLASGEVLLKGVVQLLDDPAAHEAALQKELANLQQTVGGLETIEAWLVAEMAAKDAAPAEGSSGGELEGSTVPPASAAQRAQRSTASREPQAAAGNTPAPDSIRGCSMVGQDLASGKLLFKGVVELLEAPAPQVAALQKEVADRRELAWRRLESVIYLQASLVEKMAAKDAVPSKAGDASS